MYASLSVGESFVLIKEKCPVAQGRIAFVLLYPALLVLSHVDVCEMSLFFFGLVKNVKEMSCIRQREVGALHLPNLHGIHPHVGLGGLVHTVIGSGFGQDVLLENPK